MGVPLRTGDRQRGGDSSQPHGQLLDWERRSIHVQRTGELTQVRTDRVQRLSRFAAGSRNQIQCLAIGSSAIRSCGVDRDRSSHMRVSDRFIIEKSAGGVGHERRDRVRCGRARSLYRWLRQACIRPQPCRRCGYCLCHPGEHTEKHRQARQVNAGLFHNVQKRPQRRWERQLLRILADTAWGRSAKEIQHRV